jgi:hypothetical protein
MKTVEKPTLKIVIKVHASRKSILDISKRKEASMRTRG